MSERYARLFSLPQNLYATGSPVVIAAGALLKDNQTGKVLAQLKLRNIGGKTIKAATVSVEPMDTVGQHLGEPVAYQYLDLHADRDADFGQKIPIALPDFTTRSFAASVVQVIFTDNSIWNADSTEWKPLNRPHPLDALRDRDLAKQFRIEYGGGCENLLLEQKDLWHCVCGGVNRQEETNCHKCRKALAELQAIDMEGLRVKKDERLARERAEAEAARIKAQQEAEIAKAKAKKIGKITAIVAAAIVVVALITRLILPASKYHTAIGLMEAGQYEVHNATSDGRGFTPGYFSDSALTNNSVDIRSVTLAELDNGDMQYTMEFRATRGMNVGFLSMPDESYYPDLIMMRDQKTSGSWETVSFEVEGEEFRTADLFGVVIWDGVQGKIEEGEKGYQLLMEIMEESKEIYVLTLEKTEAMALQTSGNPVGESKRVSCSTEGNVTVHSLTAQLLDNGYVRYTLDYTAPQGYYISFFNPPSGSVFMYVSEKPTSDERGTYVVDVKKEANNSVDSITIKFFSQDYGDYVSFDPIRF